MNLYNTTRNGYSSQNRDEFWIHQFDFDEAHRNSQKHLRLRPVPVAHHLEP
jgi:hypothetical protein